MSGAKKGGNQSLVRIHNQKLILEEMLTNHQLSRADLVKKLNISAPSVSSNVESLLDADILKEIELHKKSTTAGRKPIMLKFNHEYGYVIGIDLSKGRVALALGNLLGEIITQSEGGETGNKVGVELIDLVEQEIHRFIDQADIQFNKILALAIASPGIVTPKTHIRLDPKQLHWEDIPVDQILSERLHLPVILENDINVAALGEYWSLKEENDIEDMIFISVGRGLGSGLIVNGALYKGVFGGAGEVAFMSIQACESSHPQYSETLISVQALRKYLRENNEITHEQYQQWDDTQILNYTLEQLQQNNQAVQKIVDKMANFLAIIVGNLAAIINPQMLLVGGEMLLLGDYFIPIVKDVIEKMYPFPITIKVSDRIDSAGLTGSIGIAKEYALEALIQ